MQERCVSLLVAGEVRPADRPDEDGVSREDELRFGASSQVRHEQPNAFGVCPGVSRTRMIVFPISTTAVVERLE